MAEALPKSVFRQGRRVPRNVYHGDEPLFMAATDELAAELVLILNAGATALRGGFAEAEQMRERAATCAETPDAWAYQWEGQPTYFAIGAAIRDLPLAQQEVVSDAS